MDFISCLYIWIGAKVQADAGIVVGEKS